MIHRLKPFVFAACLVPLLFLVWRALTGGLSANPIEDVTHATGIWTLRFVMITLVVTPLRRLSAWHGIVGFRRMIGLFAFFYGCLHFLTYLVLDQFFAFDYIVEDIRERPYITIGFTGFVLMVPLAVTSTQAMIRRLGRRWRVLHRLIYVTATCGVLHYLWLVKADLQRPLAYAAILGVLFGFRLVWRLVESRGARARATLAAEGPRAAG